MKALGTWCLASKNIQWSHALIYVGNGSSGCIRRMAGKLNTHLNGLF